MKNTELAEIIRKEAERLQAQCNSDDRAIREAVGHDAPELLRTLARVVEGKSLYRAFGAPGNWGYGTPIGDTYFAALKDGSIPVTKD